MRRYPAFDPPEYVEWAPDPELLVDYRRRIDDDPGRREIIRALDRPALLALYRDLVRTRLHDIGLKRWVRTGVISKAWLGTGEEAVTVGAVAALDRAHDVVCPMIRNAGALPMMGVPLAQLFRGYLATPDSLSSGWDLHLGDLSRRVLQPISHMGTNAQIMAGVALAFASREEPRVALTFVGDGATRTAAFHEGVNLAAVLRLPVVYVIQDNQVALGTRREQHGRGDPGEFGAAYGLPTWSADGNHVLDCHATTRLAVDHARGGGGAAVVVARTFRMGGHATHDEREARETFDPELFREWGRRDPIGLYESWLREEGVDEGVLNEIEREVTDAMERAAEDALASRGLERPFRVSPHIDARTLGATSSLSLRPL